MIRILSLFALFLLCGFSCSNDNEEVKPRNEYPAMVSKVDVPETAVVGEPVTATVYFVVNNSCGQFGEFAVSMDQLVYTIKVYPVYVGEACAMYLPTREVSYRFTPEKPGTYTLKFWAGEDKFITKTIVVSGAGA
ncbi:hypothetical protein [Pontibacter akesuensis]|uniref:GOLD domain-containing protein n=1 Tax=Pontibacter akesuensis TaxID=388950 RepID=A0A1I7J3C1_9BACT|nr:hypothetical protein [Pontibacter akesuensis]GHA72644.1 hypothetical protein GCM10007389_28020 [Pontibacter akesuensis]SFU79676.1 hypothetical protein SAMN04487941_2457 [Pontibacter akesuensis]